MHSWPESALGTGSSTVSIYHATAVHSPVIADFASLKVLVLLCLLAAKVLYRSCLHVSKFAWVRLLAANLAFAFGGSCCHHYHASRAAAIAGLRHP